MAKRCRATTLNKRIHLKAWHLMFDIVKYEGGATDVAKQEAICFCSKINGSLAVIVGRGVNVVRDVLEPKRCLVANATAAIVFHATDSSLRLCLDMCKLSQTRTENPTSPQCSLVSGACLAISTSPRTHARARSHLFPSDSRVENWLGFGPLKGWVGRPQHTCTHKRASWCVPYGVLRVFVSWTCFCRAPAWSCCWLESKQKCLETRTVHHSGGSA